MSSFVLGVDGGTTKTIALVADDRGQVVSAARGAGSNWSGPHIETPMNTVVAVARQALQGAGIAAQQVALGMLCLAGADWPEDYTRRQAYLADFHLAQRLIVKNDSFAGLRAGTAQPYGLVIAAGTGINAAAIAPDGREWAFGYYVDRGGAGSTAEDALRAVLREEDRRGPKTTLTPMVLGKLGYPTAEALLRALVAGEVDPGRRNALCPLVFEAADAGDEVAAEIIVREGLALAEYAVALVRRFEMHHLAFDVVLVGGVFRGRGALLVQTLTQAIHQAAPDARIVRARYEPAVGALLLAYDALGIVEDDTIHQALAATAPGPEFYSTADGGKLPFRRKESQA